MAIVALNSTARNVSIAVMTRQNSTRRLGAFTAQPTTLISKRSVVRRAENEEQQPSTSEQEATPEPSTRQQKLEEEPIWVRRERERAMAKQGGGDLPFGVYLLTSAIVAIAAVGSIFEYTSKNPIFDVIEADSPLYAPILGLFALTGLPTSGYLFYKAVSTANKEAERMDKLDGY